MKQISFTHLRYAGAALDDSSFTAELGALKAEAALLSVGIEQSPSGFMDILIAGDETMGGRLRALLSKYRLHWKTVFIDAELTFPDGSINRHAAAVYFVRFIGKDVPIVGGSNGSMAAAVHNQEQTVLVETPPELAARFAADSSTFVGGPNPSAVVPNKDEVVVIEGSPAARLADDFARIFGDKGS